MNSALKIRVDTAIARALILAVLPAGASAQSLLHDVGGPIQFNPPDFGRSVALMGDANGDGLSDFAVAAFGDSSFASLGGTVTVFSGSSGALLHQLQGPASTLLGFTLTFVGDVNGDGRADVLTGSSTSFAPAFVRVYSGADGAILHDIPVAGQPRALAGLGDFNNDAFDDFAVTTGNEITFYSGVDGAVLASWTQPGMFLANDLACIGDLDGDGTPDIVAGNTSITQNGYVEAGAAFALSGATGAVIHRFAGDDFIDRFGIRVRGVGDVDADGVPDIGVGAVDQQPGTFDVTFWGFVRIFSGQTGELLYEVRPTRDDGEAFAWYVEGIGDVNLDGHDDFAVGAPRSDSSIVGEGHVRLFSGRTGEKIFTIRPTDAEVGGFGVDIEGRQDVNGDGHTDILIGAPASGDSSTGQALRGRAQVFSGACFNIRSFCESLPNSSGRAARVFADGSTSLVDDNFALEVEGGRNGRPAVLIFGDQATQVPFGDGFRCIGGSATFLRGEVSTFEFPGRLRQEVSLSTGALSGLMAGDTMLFQFIFRDPGGPGGSGFNLTNGVSVTFCQ